MQPANDNMDTASVGFGAFKKPLAVSMIALMTASAMGAPAFATMDNTFTATGDSPSGTDDVSDNVDEQVDLEDVISTLALTKSGAITTDTGTTGQLDVGDVVTYTYTLVNTGTVSLDDVTLSDAHDGTGSLSFGSAVLTNTSGNSLDGTATDLVVERLDPGDLVTFTSTYTITAADVAAAGADGDLDNVASATSVYDDDNDPGTANTTVDSNDAPEELPYAINASISVTKVADQDTNVPAGTTITYTYRVINDGNVPVSAITLVDVHQGSNTLGPFTFVAFDGTAVTGTSVYTAGNVIDVLQPGDAAEFTRTYVVSQDDVDSLQ